MRTELQSDKQTQASSDIVKKPTSRNTGNPSRASQPTTVHAKAACPTARASDTAARIQQLEVAMTRRKKKSITVGEYHRDEMKRMFAEMIKGPPSPNFINDLRWIRDTTTYFAAASSFDDFCEQLLGWPMEDVNKLVSGSSARSEGPFGAAINHVQAGNVEAKTAFKPAPIAAEGTNNAAVAEQFPLLNKAEVQGGATASGEQMPMVTINVPAHESPVAPPGNQRSPAYWIGRINTQVGRSAQDLVELGNLFLKAKGALKHGDWKAMFRDSKLRFSLRWAQKLMQVTSNPALAKAKNSSLLPPSSDALSTLARLDPVIIEGAITEGTIRPDMTIAEAKRFVLGQEGEDNAPTGQRPFDYNATLTSLVRRIERSLGKVPADQVSSFVKGLTEKIQALNPGQPSEEALS